MIGITIGIGEEWAALSRQTAARMRQMTGLECRVIESTTADVAHPSWIKCHVHRMFPEVDSFLLFDADLLPFQPWDPAGMFEAMRRPFIAVPEPNMNDQILAECAAWKLGYPDTYINGGLLIYGREHGWIWDKVWAYHPHGGRWAEQSALNRVLADEQVEMCRLPRHYNLLAQEGRIKSIYSRSTLKDAVNVHTCGLHNAASVRSVHESILDYHATGKAGATRIDLLRDMRRKFGPGSRGAEIGVFEGGFSVEIQRILQPRDFHLVDLFHGMVASGNVNGQNLRMRDMATMPDILAAALPDATIHRIDSIAWMESMDPMSLDWVYLDTNHDYGQTLAELEAAWFVVRNGGIIAGHDFSSAFPGVQQAVREFCENTGLSYRVYDGDLLPSFAIEVENAKHIDRHE